MRRLAADARIKASAVFFRAVSSRVDVGECVHIFLADGWCGLRGWVVQKRMASQLDTAKRNRQSKAVFYFEEQL